MWLPFILTSKRSHSRRARPTRRASRRLTVELLEDRALPSFLAPVSYPVGANPQAVAVGDFTGTGIPDLVVANNQGSGTISVLLGKGDGTFQAAQYYAVGGTPASVAVGDFNNDGKLDIVTANDSNGTVSVLLGKGDGTFQPALNYVLPTQLAFGQIPLTQIPRSVAVGDFDKDGKLDVAVTAYTTYFNGYTTSQQDYVNVLIGNGAGGFTTDNSYALGAATAPLYFTPGSFKSSVAVGDFRGNGNLDLAVAEADVGVTYSVLAQVSVLLGNGNGTFGLPTVLATTQTSWPNSVAIRDFDGDKTLDIVTANSFSGGVSVFLGKGDGTFQLPQNFAVGGGPAAVAVGDFNNDGKPDLVTANPFSGTVSVLLGTGTGTFPTHQEFAAGGQPTAVAVGDFNRDGWPDLAVADPHTNSVLVLLNAADWRTMAVSSFPSPTTAGTAGSFTVTVKNADGTTATNYVGTVHFTSSDPQAVLPADYTFTAADAGVHTFSATLKTAGTQSITATDTTKSTITGTEAGITVNPAAASKFILTAPSSVTAGVQFSLTVMVEDAYGNVVTGYTGTVQFTSTDTTAKLPQNYTFTAADKGVHTFTGLKLRTKGYQTITITDTLNSSLTASVIIDVL